MEFFLVITWDIGPYVIPGVELFRWYGALWAIGILLGVQVLQHINKNEGLPIKQVDNLVFILIVGIILGARLGHILFYDPVHYWHNPSELLPVRFYPHFELVGVAGLASHGGVIGVILAVLYVSKKYNLEILWLLDRLTISAALLGCFIRLGNLMNSEIVGVPTSVPWAFIFSQFDSIPRHPSQLYEAIFYFSIFIFLFTLWKSGVHIKRQGLLFGLGLSLIFIQRFFIEFLKEDQVNFESEMLFNMGQLLSIPMVLIGILFVGRALNNSKKQMR